VNRGSTVFVKNGQNIFNCIKLRVVKEGHIQIYWSLFEADFTKISAEITIHNTSRVIQLLLYDKYLNEGKYKGMAVHTMKAHWEWKHSPTLSHTRH
jgi:hypothetical protein